MRDAGLVEKNLELSFEFTRYLFAPPEMEARIPKGALVVLLPDYDDKLKRFNLKNARQQKEESQPVVCIRIKKLAADRSSRLVGAKIEQVG
jgi:hypothetical protein